MSVIDDSAVVVPEKITEQIQTAKHSVEFFHIYTDEQINDRHQMSIQYLRSLDAAWNFDYDRIVLIDNYNPTEHVLSADDVLRYLDAQGVLPRYWAYEKDMVPNAQALLETVTEKHLKRNYERYIESHGKYPCSLLTASWYLTRLGKLDTSSVHSTDLQQQDFVPASRLFNLLPQDYRSVEARARQIILHSAYNADADRIQDLFFPVDSGRVLDLF